VPLGYPECCVRASADQDIEEFESLIDGYIREYQTKDESKLLELLKRDAQIGGTRADEIREARNALRIGRSIITFPFVQFTACTDCIDKPGSQTAEANKEMGALAEDLDPAFAKSIRDLSADDIARVVEVEKQLKALLEPQTRQVGRNDPCPCGSGKKYKKCCLLKA
jgi:uncharacterized protein YecA (UPF0149 family)